uniref:Uncharacterized protein n=1 Tax=Plectus sambesii TaxID=2011161 RepID=A0A914WMX9_9BILA
MRARARVREPDYDDDDAPMRARRSRRSADSSKSPFVVRSPRRLPSRAFGGLRRPHPTRLLPFIVATRERRAAVLKERRDHPPRRTDQCSPGAACSGPPCPSLSALSSLLRYLRTWRRARWSMMSAK